MPEYRQLPTQTQGRQRGSGRNLSGGTDMDAQTVSGSRGKKTEHKSYDEIMGMRIEVAKQLVAENPKITREKLVHLLVRRGMKKVLATEAAIRALNN